MKPIPELANQFGQNIKVSVAWKTIQEAQSCGKKKKKKKTTGYNKKKIIKSTEEHKVLNKWKIYFPRKSYAILMVSITS